MEVEGYQMSSPLYDIDENNYIVSGVNVGTTVEEFLNQLEIDGNAKISIVDGNEVRAAFITPLHLVFTSPSLIFVATNPFETSSLATIFGGYDLVNNDNTVQDYTEHWVDGKTAQIKDMSLTVNSSSLNQSYIPAVACIYITIINICRNKSF